MEILQTLKTIDTVVSIAKPIIETVAPKLQESMKEFAERMLVLAEKYPSIAEFAQIIDKAAEIMGDVLYVLGINMEPADVFGAKIAQSDKGIDEFDSIEAYITYLKNEIELDKEKFDALSTKESVAYSIIGMAVEAGAIGEKLRIEIPADVVELGAKIAEIGKISVETKEIISLISKLKEEGISDLNDICDCIKGTGDSDRLKTGEVLLEVLDVLKPNEGKDIFNEIIDEVRE